MGLKSLFVGVGCAVVAAAVVYAAGKLGVKVTWEEVALVFVLVFVAR